MRKFSNRSLGEYELNIVEKTNQLPFITIQNPPLKLLIDTGATTCLLRPSVVETYFPDKIYQESFNLNSCGTNNKGRFRAIIPIFKEFKTDSAYEVCLFDFHKYFDGLLGLPFLKQNKLKVDLENNALFNDNIEIKLQYNRNDDSFIDLGPQSSKICKVTCDQEQGIIEIPSMNSEHCYTLSAISQANNYETTIEIFNPTNESIKIKRPHIQSKPFKENEFSIYTAQLQYNNPTFEISQPDIRTGHLNSEEKSNLLKLCNEFSDIFHNEHSSLTFTNKIKHEIKTKDEIPIHSKTYRYPYVHKQEVERQIDQMLKNGIIRHSDSPYSAPIWIVPKKLDASNKQKWRIVVDYRKLNETTIDDRFPIPNITDILDRLGRANYFTTLDLANGFHQIEMSPDSIHKTAFSTETGHYEYLRMPFGLKNAPSTFQRVMNNILKGLINQICLVYMDDIIIFSSSLEEHLKNLKAVFSRIRESNMKIQPDKSEFLRKEVEFLGHIVTPEGIKPNKKKLAAIKDFPIPTTAKEIKSFLGLVGYYRKFINNFAKITKPLTQCLKKGQTVKHTSEFLNAINTCKDLLCNEPILQYPDFSKEFVVTTDASQFAVGAILSQGPINSDKPISYASRTLNPAEINYSTIEKELLAIIFAVKSFRPYLFGRKFKIVTDHKPLTWLFSLKEPNSKLIRWRLLLSEYDYEIIYKKGKINSNADALSRIKLPDQTLEVHPIDNDNNSLIVETGDEDINELLNNQLREINDSNTQHSSAENPILDIPITEHPVNFYKNQIVFLPNTNRSASSPTKSKPFDKIRLTIHCKNENLEKTVINTFKDFINPKTKHCIYVDDTFTEGIKRISITLPQVFKNNAYSLCTSTKLLKDVEVIDDQRMYIKFFHETKTGHRGIKQTIEQLSRKYYWPNLTDDVTNYINTCNICLENKYERRPFELHFELTPTPSKPFESLHIDTFHIDKIKCLTIIDVFSKYGQCYALQKFNAIEIFNKFLSYISHHGIPLKITCDNGTEFNNNILRDFCKLHSITLHFTTPHNSNSNSPVERFHSTILEHLRCIKRQNPNNTIFENIKYAVIAYNNSIHSTTNLTPFQVIHCNLDNRDPFDLTNEIITTDYVSKHKEISKKLFEKIHETSLNNKEQWINKNNETRSPAPDIPTDTPVYHKTNTRNKLKPLYQPSTSKANKGPILKMSTTKRHKSKLKPPRKLKKK